MPSGFSVRAATVMEVSLSLSELDAAQLAVRVGGAPALVQPLLARPGSSQWATSDESLAVAAWLDAAARELNEPGFARALREDAHEVSAVWRWPAHPLVDVCLDDREIAVCDYLPASASAHWFVHWTAEPKPPGGVAPVPLMSLAGRVPEEADADEAMRAAVLDAAIEGAVTELTGRPTRLDLADG